MSLRGVFWRFAHKRYQTRKPNKVWEFAAISWLSLALMIYGGALLADFTGNAGYILPGLIATGLPLMFFVLHRRIRLERAKGSDALYRKRLATNG